MADLLMKHEAAIKQLKWHLKGGDWGRQDYAKEIVRLESEIADLKVRQAAQQEWEAKIEAAIALLESDA